MPRFWQYANVLFTLLMSFSCALKLDRQDGSSSDDIYSETPCELRSLSVLKDVQGNLWGYGKGNLWWFNSTNLSWSLLPLPESALNTTTWKVACADPKRYVALMSSSSALILHLPWQHWQQVDTEDLNGILIDSNANWCKSGILHAIDNSMRYMYILDHEEARWTLVSEDDIVEGANITKMSEFNDHVSRSWTLPNGSFVLAGGHDSCDHILISNSSGIGWSLLKKREDDKVWPDLEGRVVTWIEENSGPTLWLWKSDNTTAIWAFNMTEMKWEEKTGNTSPLPNMIDVLTIWIDDDQLCFLKRTEICTLQYSASATECWNSVDSNQNTTVPVLAEFSEIYSTTSVPQEMSQFDIHTTNIISREDVPEDRKPEFISAHSIINKHSLLAALQTEIDSPDSIEDIPITAALPSRHNAWHQHTSIFGSVIFFGTSLTIFGVVGSLWCMKRCVHFPKEALLLRDPPSVRYTAIPDNVPFDARGQSTSAYTVIPDSIA